MARHPDWFERLDPIIEAARRSDGVEWIGRKELQALFGCSERDSIRLLHKFGAVDREDALTLARSALLVQLEAIRAGSRYASFLRQRHEVAKQITAARAEAAARQFRIAGRVPETTRPDFQGLPKTITWRRSDRTSPGHFEVLYADGADLMRQIGEFLTAAGGNREEFFAGTEPSDDPTTR